MQSTLQVNGTHTYTFKLDTGAEANILPFDLYKQVCSSLLRPTSTVLCGFGSAVIKPLGSLDVTVCDREGREFPLLFYATVRDVAAAPQTPQLGGGPRPTLGAQVSLKLLFGYVTIFSSADLFTTDLNCRKKLACDIISECNGILSRRI